MDEFYDDFLKSMDIWCTCNGHLNKKFKAKRSDICSIKIEKTDDKTVSCIAFDKNNKPIYKSKSKCGPNDIFDFNIGAKLALDRLYEGYEPYNGLIYIHHYPGSGLTDSSVYRVVNGKIVGCRFHSGPESDPYIFSDMTDGQLSRKLQIEVYGSDAPSAKVIAYFIHNDKT